MKLSACYIVGKGEAAFEKSLQSLGNLADEIIVIATALDQSIWETAVKYQASIYSYEWHDDFAAARNFALAKATGDWIVFLDADEYMAGSSVKLWRNVVENTIHEVLGVEEIFIKLIDFDAEQENPVLGEVFVPRFFVRRPDVYYQGRIHEDLRRTDGMPLRTAFLSPEDLILIHTGYSGKLGMKKAARNLRILLEEMKIAPDPAEHYMAIAEAYEGMEDFEKAIEYAKQDILLNGRRSISYASRSYRVLFRLWESTTRDMDAEILKFAEKSVTDFPELPEFWAQYAVYLANVFHYKEAVAAMEKAILCFNCYQSLEPSVFDQNAVRQGEEWIGVWHENASLAKSLRISACVITKNEEEVMGQWIQTLKTCTDEQILVDTGSTDHTVEIAAAAGMKTYYFSWQDDFAAAKNFALEQATGDWIVFLDADEYFSEDACRDIRHIIAREHRRVDSVDAILCPLINIDVDQYSQEINRSLTLRIFRNAPYLRYTGKVHENIRNEHGHLNILVEKKNLAIYHTGYSSQRLQGKLKRNLSLLLADIEKNGEQVHHYRYLLDCYIGLGEYEKAIKYAKLHIESAATSVGSESDVYRNLIIALNAIQAEPKEIELYCETAIRKFPAIPDFYIYKGMLRLQQKDFLTAKEFLEKAYDLSQKAQYDCNDSTNYSQLMVGLYCHLAETFYQLGERKNAEAYLAMGLKENRYNEEVFATAHEFLKNKPADEVIRFLDQYYALTKEDISFIVQQWGKFSQNEVYVHYMKQLMDKEEIKNEKVFGPEILAKESPTNSFQQNVKLAAGHIQVLLYCLFQDKQLFSLPQVKQVLPDTFLPWIERYHGEKKKIEPGEYDSYVTILQMMKIFNNEDILKCFCKLAAGFSTVEQRTIAGICWQEGFWQEGKEVYERLLSMDIENEFDLYREAGICFFHCEDEVAARKYLQKALNLVVDENQLHELKTYLSWLE